MDIVTEPKVDWLGYKWYFIGLSLVLAAVGAISLFLGQGLNFGVDFTGGTLVYIKFKDDPELDRVRTILTEAKLQPEGVTRFDDPAARKVQVRMARVESEGAGKLEEQSQVVIDALHASYDAGADAGGKRDLNNLTKGNLASLLLEADPLGKKAGGAAVDPARDYAALAARVIDAKTQAGGVLADWSQLDGLNLEPAVRQALESKTYLGSFAVLSVETVGPKVGRELQERARAAVAMSLLGMLVYIGFRFRPIYGLAAIIALAHDVFITIGFFSLSYKEISLTVVAGLLTLVGYSINDTIVVFDRVRENQRLLRRQDLASIFNTSINQTLNRTIMTSGMTFLAVFALYLLGGQALNGFSFALVIGIIVGTYSSIAIASPIVLWWQNYRDSRKERT